MTGEMYSFRYVDDLLFCFQHEHEATRFKWMLKERLQKFGSELNEDKTKVCRFGRFARENGRRNKEARTTFNFLGYTFYNRISKANHYTRVTKW